MMFSIIVLEKKRKRKKPKSMEGITDLINAHTVPPEKQILCNVNGLYRKCSCAYFILSPCFFLHSCSVWYFKRQCVLFPPERLVRQYVAPGIKLG